MTPRELQCCFDGYARRKKVEFENYAKEKKFEFENMAKFAIMTGACVRNKNITRIEQLIKPSKPTAKKVKRAGGLGDVKTEEELRQWQNEARAAFDRFDKKEVKRSGNSSQKN